MHFSLPVFIGAALAFSQSVSAQGLTGITIPSSITPGELFNVTYQWNNGLSNCEEYTAIYGLTSDANVNEGNTIGSQTFTTKDLSKIRLGPNFNATIRAPNRDWFEIYAKNGSLPQPWFLSSANIQQIGASGGVELKVYHANTTVNY